MSIRIIDLRSDTITRPTLEMKQAMMDAEVGDDVWGDDPTVNALEEKVAKLFGMEAALFCVSGTMANQIGIQVHVHPGQEVICDATAHIYLYEGGGIMTNSNASVQLLHGNYGRLNAAQINEAIRSDSDIHATPTGLVALENTMNKGGGVYYDFEEIQRIHQVCKEKEVPLHLDGARLFNALVETGEKPYEYGQVFDTISICLSKGLGCPIGSVLIGSKVAIRKARRIRKRMGGGWRQAGMLAAAGIYALDNNIDRLKDDHSRARIIADLLERQNEINRVYPVATNIVIAELNKEISEQFYIHKLEEKGILATAFGKGLVRMVTHLDFMDADLEEINKRLK